MCDSVGLHFNNCSIFTFRVFHSIVLNRDMLAVSFKPTINEPEIEWDGMSLLCVCVCVYISCEMQRQSQYSILLTIIYLTINGWQTDKRAEKRRIRIIMPTNGYISSSNNNNNGCDAAQQTLENNHNNNNNGEVCGIFVSVILKVCKLSVGSIETKITDMCHFQDITSKATAFCVITNLFFLSSAFHSVNVYLCVSLCIQSISSWNRPIFFHWLTVKKIGIFFSTIIFCASVEKQCLIFHTEILEADEIKRCNGSEC